MQSTKIAEALAKLANQPVGKGSGVPGVGVFPQHHHGITALKRVDALPIDLGRGAHAGVRGSDSAVQGRGWGPGDHRGVHQGLSLAPTLPPRMFGMAAHNLTRKNLHD